MCGQQREVIPGRSILDTLLELEGGMYEHSRGATPSQEACCWTLPVPFHLRHTLPFGSSRRTEFADDIAVALECVRRQIPWLLELLALWSRATGLAVCAGAHKGAPRRLRTTRRSTCMLPHGRFASGGMQYASASRSDPPLAVHNGTSRWRKIGRRTEDNLLPPSVLARLLLSA